MSERLSDEEIAEGLRIAEDVIEFGEVATKVPRYCLEKLARLAFHHVRELRVLRAAALTAEEREALRDARACVDGSPHPGMTARERLRAIAVLDKLTKEGM